MSGQSTQDQENKKLLIIEDDPIISSVYTKRFSNLGFEVGVVANGSDALERIQEDKPEAILLDLLLPEKNGDEILREVKESEAIKDIPVVVLSNVSDPQKKKEVLEYGAEGYLVKAETDLDEVVKATQEVLQ